MTQNKLDTILEQMNQQHLSHLIISDPFSIDYLIGYYTDPGERLLLLVLQADGQMRLILNRLFPPFQPQTRQENLQVDYYNDGEAILELLSKKIDFRKTGVDKKWPSIFLIELMNHSPHMQVVHGSPIIDQLRAVKTPAEIEKMTDASKRNDQAMQEVINLLKKAYTEIEMVDQLAKIYTALDCDGFSFEPIIAYGPNGADPHHITDDSKPEPGQSVVIDIGSSRHGYCSDMTRTVFYGQPSQRDQEIYHTVLEANLAAIKQIKPGVTFASIDQAARQVIEEAGYGEYFTHRTGHFIGREVHEYGDVGPFNEAKVEVGNVFSIEPGIYLPGEMGVRIEDLVVVTEDGCQLLNHYPKELIIIEAEVNV